jgi:hypothetical protein
MCVQIVVRMVLGEMVICNALDGVIVGNFGACGVVKNNVAALRTADHAFAPSSN